jgi:DNA invertase Pin-like site-specific DNA recombinase
MLVGYARTSTIDQEAGLAAQCRELEAAGCERIFAEQVSSVAARRERLDEALDFVRAGDVFVVTRLDRLARSVADLVRITARLERDQVALRVLALGLDTAGPTGQLMVHMLAAIGEFERSLMKERQVEGINLAKRRGKYRGRAPTARAKAGEVARLRADGLGAAKIAERLKISRASVYRVLAETAPAG